MAIDEASAVTVRWSGVSKNKVLGLVVVRNIADDCVWVSTRAINPPDGRPSSHIDTVFPAHALEDVILALRKAAAGPLGRAALDAESTNVVKGYHTDD